MAAGHKPRDVADQQHAEAAEHDEDGGAGAFDATGRCGLGSWSDQLGRLAWSNRRP